MQFARPKSPTALSLMGATAMPIYTTKKLTTEIFVTRSTSLLKHKNKYLYDKTKYVNGRTKVIIGCPIHGYFMQSPKLHLCGHGCTKCATLARPAKKIKTTIQFIKDAISVHNDAYGYAKSEYKGAKVPIEITCQIHGYFWQLPNGHLSGQGCPKCAPLKIAKLLSKTTEQFIKDANIVHNYAWNYSLVEYVSSHKKVIIMCNLHGKFSQKPSSHLSGNGCPRCKLSNGERLIENFLLKSNIDYQRQFKIENCRDKNMLPFDFSIISDEKIIGLIEFQGSQHYFSFEHFGGIKKLQYTQKHDKIKSDYCKEHNIPLLIIPYTDKNKIDITLFKFLHDI
jgi:hypothetical protein